MYCSGVQPRVLRERASTCRLRWYCIMPQMRQYHCVYFGRDVGSTAEEGARHASPPLPLPLPSSEDKKVYSSSTGSTQRRCAVSTTEAILMRVVAVPRVCRQSFVFELSQRMRVKIQRSSVRYLMMETAHVPPL